MRYLFFLFLLTILAGCAGGPYPASSPYYRIPEGSRLVLKQPLTIPPNSADVFIQYGKVVTSKETDKYYPHCWFLSWKVLETPQIIKPGAFIVTRTQKYEDYVQKFVADRVASSNVIAGIRLEASQIAVEYITELNIHSDAQPDIRSFVCNHWEDPADAYHLTVAEIRNTLGDIGELQLNTSH